METGSFTLPGEAGYEALTLAMAKEWGADVIRDSDGTVLSDEIVESGYRLYSTICIIRDHNAWAKEHLDKLQQTFLITSPIVADCEKMEINLLKDFYEEQFAVNDSPEALAYWQVYDRTTNEVITDWSYDIESKSVRLQQATLWHKYTVSFLAYRIWEEISMYNHTTNHWEKEHLMQIDPIHEETRAYLNQWMRTWCETHKATDVVRFTSMFYNFVWIWGSNERNPYLFSDWASYDFTVSPKALSEFKKAYGYALTAEDFVNQGKYQVTHMPATKQKRDWMEFIHRFVIGYGKELIDIVHQYGKKAYVFYDDSWVGVEPYHSGFEEFGFDGIIKCVFSGYEARLCAGVKTPVHEIRLHPYLFPVGLGGAPTFMEGGNPTLEAKKYWRNLRRALLRQPVDRIGLGGYLHLVEGYPDFIQYMKEIADEFRRIKGYHTAGGPSSFGIRVAVLHYWGKLRSWTLSGHFHETYMHDLIHINESLAGLPVEVAFIDFEELRTKGVDEYDVIINAGRMGDAWSGGAEWEDSIVTDTLTKWVYEGGTLVGINEPSAVKGFDTTFRMAHVFGIDLDLGERVSHGKWIPEYDTEWIDIPQGAKLEAKQHLYLIDGETKVLMEEAGQPCLTCHAFGKGTGIYMSAFTHTLANTRLLLYLLLAATHQSKERELMTDDYRTECAYYEGSHVLVIYNNSEETVEARVVLDGESYFASLEAYESKTFQIN